MQDLLLILDFDKQYSKTSALRLRAKGVNCKIVPSDIKADEVILNKPLGLLLAGGIEGRISEDFDKNILNLKLPILALGDAASSVCKSLGGSVSEIEEVHLVESIGFTKSPLTEGINESERMIHQYRAYELGDNLEPLAYLSDEVLGFFNDENKIYGLGFQIEANDQEGLFMLLNFVTKVCAINCSYSLTNFIAEKKAFIREKLGDEDLAVCAITGGVASGTAAVLAHRALNGKLKCLFIDTGLLRENEGDDFCNYYMQKEGLDIIRIKAHNTFIDGLKGKTSPQEKIDVITSLMEQELNNALNSINYKMVVRGSTKADMWRGTKPIIKEEGKIVVSPFEELFKEEVRTVAENLGMPSDIYNAQPFPGTGLALRIDGEASARKIASLRRADAIFTEELVSAGLTKKLSRYYVSMHEVGAGRDGKTQSIALHAKTQALGQDGNSVLIPARLPYDLMERVAGRIVQACPEIKNVNYDLSQSAI